MSADRMERVQQKAREVERTTDELYGSGGTYAAEAFVAGAHRLRTLTDAEWTETREKVARAIHDRDVSTPWEHWSRHPNGADVQADWRDKAEAAMRAVGLRREGE